MKREILVPLDFSETTGATLSEGAELAHLMGASLCLLHVEDVSDEMSSYAISRPFLGFGMESEITGIGGLNPKYVHPAASDQESSSLVKLQEYQERLFYNGIESTTMTGYGSVAREIVTEAKRLGVCMIVMGSHGRGRFRRLTGGSISRYVSRHASCPVVIVPAKARVDTHYRLAG